MNPNSNHHNNAMYLTMIRSGSEENIDNQQVEKEVNESSDIVSSITSFYVRKPWLAYCSCFIFILIVAIGGAQASLLALSEASEYDWTISTTDASEKLDAFNDAMSKIYFGGSGGGSRREDNKRGAVTFAYSTTDGSEIFTPAQLLKMCEAEAVLVNDPDYSSYCRLNTNGQCLLPSASIVQKFYDFDSMSNWNCYELPESNVTATKNELYAYINANQRNEEKLGFWFAANTISVGISSKTQSIHSLGLPLEGYNSTEDRADEQDEKSSTFLHGKKGGVGGVEKKLFAKFSMDLNDDGFFKYWPSPYRQEATNGNLDIKWWSIYMRENNFARLINADLSFAIFSVLFVLIWMRMHLKSSFLALTGMFMIFLSLPFSMVIYRGIYQIDFFSELHSLVLFIVLGVGADDVFVLVDAWKQSKLEISRILDAPEDGEFDETELRHQRLKKTYRHTLATVFNTSFTTAFAFVATGLSPLMTISTFGHFAATCIVMNYIFVMTLMPPALILHDMYFDLSNCNPIKKIEHPTLNDKEENMDTQQGQELPVMETGIAYALDSVIPSTGDERSTSEDDQKNQQQPGSGLVEAYINFIKYPGVAITVILALLAFGIFNGTQGVRLETPTESERWFPLDSMITLIEKMFGNDFLSSDSSNLIKIQVVFGVEGINRGNFNQYVPGENRGSVVWDEGYDITSAGCQQVFIKACEDVKTFACNSGACGASQLLARDNSTICFMDEYRKWASSTYSLDTYTMDSSTFISKLDEFRGIDDTLYGAPVDWRNYIGFTSSNDVKFGYFEFTATMKALAPMAEKGEVLDIVNNFVKHIKAYPECASQCDCSSVFQSTSYSWVWYHTEKALEFGFYQGITIAFPVAFGVLLFATKNIK